MQHLHFLRRIPVPLLALAGVCSPPASRWGRRTSRGVGVGLAVVTATLLAAASRMLSAHDLPERAVGATDAFVDVASVNPGTTIEKSQCLSIGIIEDVANQCAVLRVTHALPSVRSYNVSKTPTLIYHYDQAADFAVVAVNITRSAPTIPDSIRTTLFALKPDGSTSVEHQRVDAGSHWAGSAPMRVAMPWSHLGGGPSRILPYRVTVEFRNGGQWVPAGQAEAELAIVRRSLATGWHLAGQEELYPGQPGGALLWVGGDGSTRKYTYRRDSAGFELFSAAAVTHPDDIIRNPADGAYYRLLPGNRRASFDPGGRHRQTWNSLGHTIYFEYVGSSRKLDYFVVGPYGAGLTYQLHYSPVDGGLDSVTSPGATGIRGATRITRAGDAIKTITDPDGRSVSFEHHQWGTFGQINARTDRRGTRVALEQEAYSPTLLSAIYWDGRNTVHHQFHSDRYHGADPSAPPTDAGAIVFFHNGPRNDGEAGMDGLRVRNNRLGAPEWIEDAYGRVTTIEHGAAAFPGLTTAVVAPTASGGFRTEASYDARGLVEQVVELNPRGDGVNAVTSVVWDPLWRMPTRVTTPGGVVTEAAYDPATGNKLWEQTGGSAYRVNFAYHGAGQGAASGLLLSWSYPGRHRVGQGYDSLQYDVLGNVRRIYSPTGANTDFTQDAIGATRSASTLIDLSSPWLRRVDSTANDVMGRVNFQRSSGPAMNGAGAEAVTVTTAYDAGGDVQSVSRSSQPDAGAIGTITTSWTYDRAGRVVKEIAPGGGSDSTTYDASGNVIQYRDGNGHTVSTTYDALNRPITRLLPAVSYAPTLEGIAARTGVSNNPPYQASIPGDTETFGYDAGGNLVRADNFAAQVRRGYYPNGQLRQDTLRIRRYTDLPSGDSYAQHQYVISHRYDVDGRRVATGYPLQLAPVLAGVVRDTVRYTYAAGSGDMTGMSDLLPQSYGFTYSSAHELLGVSRPGGITEAFGYRDDGSLSSHVIRNGSTSTYRHVDSLLRSLTLSYDARRQIRQIANSAGLKDGRISTHSGLGHLLTTQYSASGRNAFGNPLTVGNTEAFTNDALGHLLTTQESSNGQVRSGFGAGSGYSSSQPQRVYTHQPGTGRLVGMAHPDRRDTTEYDSAGNRRLSRTLFTAFPWQDPYSPAREPHEDWAFFYAPGGRLAQTDYRWLRASRMDPDDPFRRRVREEYRYDALGRRVLTRTRRSCEGLAWNGEGPTPACRLSTIRRTVWDGDRELMEIQMPGYDSDVTNSPSAPAENDVDHVQRQDEFQLLTFNSSNQFGRVAYSYARGVDQPISVTRMGYSDVKWAGGQSHYCAWGEPIAFQPLWHPRGVADIGVFADGGVRLVRTLCGQTREFAVGWKYGALAYNAQADTTTAWQGTLVEGKLDGVGLQYRRNRYYDPSTGRFTQPDPIGLAGGLNAYGFAAGDPVSYSDPFGLCTIKQRLCHWIEATSMAVGSFGGFVAGGGGPALTGVGVVASPFTAVAGAGVGAAWGLAAGKVITGALFAKSDDGASGGSADDSRISQPGEGDGWSKLRGNQGWRDQDGNIWKKDQLHKDHWDVMDRRGRQIREVDFEGRELWPNGPKNKNR